jgi:sporulation protein YlmC with PRC-barrel domain
MRTLSSLIGRRIVTEQGTTLGRCHDISAELTDTTLAVTALCVGRGGYLDRLGIRTRSHTEIPWSSITRIEGKRIIVRGSEEQSD